MPKKQNFTKYRLTVDLKERIALIAEYEDWLHKIWYGTIKSIKQSGNVAGEMIRRRNPSRRVHLRKASLGQQNVGYMVKPGKGMLDN